MNPRAKIHESATERTRASRERRKAEGYRQISVWLPGELIGKLDRLAAKKDTDRAGILAELVERAKEPKAKK